MYMKSSNYQSYQYLVKPANIAPVLFTQLNLNLANGDVIYQFYT